MKCLLAYLLLASAAHMGFSSRTKVNRLPCPDKVSLNQRKNDCLDFETGNIVASSCCDELRSCNSQIEALSEILSHKMMNFLTKCQLEESDIIFEPGIKKAEVVDGTRLCSPTCQNQIEVDEDLRKIDLQVYKSMKAKCAGNEGLTELRQKEDIVDSMHNVFKWCTLDHFDFTAFMNTARDYGKHHALFPNGQKYSCCCRPDTTQGAMSCVLKDTRIESFSENARQMVWKTCEKAMGPAYRDWHNTHKKGSVELHSDLQGLRHVGECVVPNDLIPEALGNLSRPELAMKLNKFRQEHTEYQEEVPEELEEEEE